MSQSIDWPALFAAADRARLKAYAPYSHFHVGAALLTTDGTVFTGGNVENASYGLSLCAERNVAVAAVMAGKKDFRALALMVDSQEPTSPCGMCRQTLAEFASDDLEVRSRTPQGGELRTTLGEMLPNAFRGEALKGRGP